MKISTIGLALVLIGQPALFSQSAGVHKLPPGFVDGSKNPDLIPDSAAYRLVFLSLKPPDAADQSGLVRQSAALAATGLSAADLETLKQQLAAFAASYKAWQAQAASAQSADRAALHAQVVSLVLATRDAVVKELSPDGVIRLGAYVQKAKSRMVVRP